MRKVMLPPLPEPSRPLGSAFLLGGWSGASLHPAGDGRLLVASQQDVRLFDLRAEREVCRFVNEQGHIEAASGNARGVVIADAGSVYVLGLDGEELARIAVDVTPRAVALSHDGRFVAFGGGGHGKSADKAIRIAEVVTGKVQNELGGARSATMSIDFVPTGAPRVASAADKHARVWTLGERAKGKNRPLALPHAQQVWLVRFSADGETLFTITQNTLSSWELETGSLRFSVTREGHASARFTGLAPTEHGLLTGFDRTLLLLSTSDGSVLASHTIDDAGLGHVAADGETGYASEAFTNRVRRYALPSLEPRADEGGPNVRPTALEVSPDRSKVLTCGWEPRADLFDVETGERLRTFVCPGSYPEQIEAACFTPDGDVIIAFAHTIARFDPGVEEPRWVARHDHGWKMTLVATSAEGSIFVACDTPTRHSYGNLSVRDASTGEELAVHQLSWPIVRAHAGEGEILLVGHAGALTLSIESRTIVKERRIRGAWRWERGGALSPDGARWLSARDDSVWALVDLARDEVTCEIELGEHGHPVEVSDDFVVSVHEGAVRYWDTRTGAQLAELALPLRTPRLVRALGSRDVIAMDDGEVVIVERPRMTPSPRRTEPAHASEEDWAAALREPPSVETWRRIVALFDASEATEQRLSAVSAALASWPDALRLAPAGWLDDVLSGRPQPRMRIVRAIRANHLHSSGARALAEQSDLSLAILDLSQGKISDDETLALARRFPDVEALRLASLGLGPKAVNGLAKIAWTSLVRLDLGGNRISPPAAAALVASPALSGLTDLVLAHNKKLGAPKFADALVAATHLVHLEALDLSYTDLATVDPIVRATHLTRLRSLTLDGVALTEDDLARLASAPHLARLEHLSLGWQRALGPRALGALEHAVFASTLSTLSLILPAGAAPGPQWVTDAIEREHEQQRQLFAR